MNGKKATNKQINKEWNKWDLNSARPIKQNFSGLGIFKERVRIVNIQIFIHVYSFDDYSKITYVGTWNRWLESKMGKQ
jgi:hypothetical protein